jgi:hypothetical protein
MTPAPPAALGRVRIAAPSQTFATLGLTLPQAPLQRSSCDLIEPKHGLGLLNSFGLRYRW